MLIANPIFRLSFAWLLKNSAAILYVAGAIVFYFYILPKVNIYSIQKNDTQSQSKKENNLSFNNTYDNVGILKSSFVPNLGQTDKSIKFILRNKHLRMNLLENGLITSIAKKTTSSKNHLLISTVGMDFKGANKNPLITGEEMLKGYINYVNEANETDQTENIPNYSKVKYHNLYNGIDLIYKNNDLLEYDFIIHPYMNPGKIKLHFQGAEKLSINRDGDLIIRTRSGEIRHKKPIIYQEINSEKKFITGSFKKINLTTVTFAVNNYDKKIPLIIDPTVIYSSYIGGDESDVVSSIASDTTGNIYLTGTSRSANFPVTPGTYSVDKNDDTDIFVAKLSSSDYSLIYSTYIGSSKLNKSDVNISNCIAVNKKGEVYIGGFTSSQNFPVAPTHYFPEIKKNNIVIHGNAFLLKLDNVGKSISFSAQFFAESITGIAVNSNDEVFVTGTADETFPTGIQSSNSTLPQTTKTYRTISNDRHGFSEIFVAKFNSLLLGDSSLLYATFLGGSGVDRGAAVAADDSGNVYVTGSTNSIDFPISPGAFQKNAGNRSAFVTQLDTNVGGNNSLIYSTFLGDNSSGWGIAVDNNKKIYVTGSTKEGFPVTQNGYQKNFGGNLDIFLSKLDSSAVGTDSLLYSTYFGGKSDDVGLGISVYHPDYVAITGSTISTDFPITKDAFQTALSGNLKKDSFISIFNTSGNASASLIYSTFLGGSDEDIGNSVTFDNKGNVFLSGLTYSNNFVITPDALQKSFRSKNRNYSDSFISKINFLETTVDVGLNVSSSINTVDPGKSISFSLEINNLTEKTAENVTTLIEIPLKTKFREVLPPAGWDCVNSASEERGSILCKTPSIAPNGKAKIKTVLDTNCSSANSTTDFVASVNAAGIETNLLNNMVKKTINIKDADFKISCPVKILEKADSTINGKRGKKIQYVPTSNCSSPNAVTCFPSSGHFFSVGKTPVYCSVYDSGGTIDSCNFEVEITP
jgi:Beta-propeller repeat